MFERHDPQTEAHGTYWRGRSSRSHFHYAKRFRTFKWSNRSDVSEWLKGEKRRRLIIICVFIQGSYRSVLLFHLGSSWSEKCCQKIKQLKSGSTNTSFLTAPLFSRILLLEKSKMNGKASSAPCLTKKKKEKKIHSYSMAHLISFFSLSFCTSFA